MADKKISNILLDGETYLLEDESKQDVITDLATIRDGASKGATAVQFTDFASKSKAGVILADNGISINFQGRTSADTYTLQQYNSNIADWYFIGKGTLENIKEDLVARAIQSSTFGLDIDLIEGAEQWL